MSLAEKYLKIVRSSVGKPTSKWVSIKLSECAKGGMIPNTIEALIPQVREILLDPAQERLERCIQHDAPEVIMRHERKAVEDIQSGRDPRIAILRRQLRKITGKVL